MGRSGVGLWVAENSFPYVESTPGFPKQGIPNGITTTPSPPVLYSKQSRGDRI